MQLLDILSYSEDFLGLGIKVASLTQRDFQWWADTNYWLPFPQSYLSRFFLGWRRWTWFKNYQTAVHLLKTNKSRGRVLAFSIPSSPKM